MKLIPEITIPSLGQWKVKQEFLWEFQSTPSSFDSEMFTYYKCI